MIPTILFSLFKVTVTIQGPLWLYIKFRIICSCSVNNVIRILIRIVLNLQRALSSMDISTILILCIYEHNICFYSFVSSFFNVITIYKNKASIFLVKYISGYLIFNEIVNGIVFLIFVTDSLLLVYKKVTKFWILIFLFYIIQFI